MKKRFIDFIYEGIEEYDGFEFQEDYYDYHHGQSDVRLDMYKDGEKVAYALYTIYQGKVYMKIVEAIIRNKGYGVKLMEHLAKLYGYENLERSSLTPDGVKMRKKLDKIFNYDYEKELEKRNKHIPQDVLEHIENPIIKQFLKDIVTLGYEEGWKKWIDNKDFRELMNNDEYDLNDIANIAEWIKGSIINDNDTEDEPPKYVLEDLAKILKNKFGSLKHCSIFVSN